MNIQMYVMSNCINHAVKSDCVEKYLSIKNHSTESEYLVSFYS